MKVLEKNELGSWKSAIAWILAQLGILPSMVVDPQATPTTPSAFGTQVAAFQTAISALSTAAATQDNQQRSASGDTADVTTLRSTLWNKSMKPLARVARAVIVDMPSAAPALRLPDSSVDQQGLITAATAMATQAQSYEQLLVAHGLPANFIAQLQNATALLDQALTTRRQATAARKGATSTITTEFQAGRKALELIDTMMEHALADDPASLAAWESAKRVKAAPSTTSAVPSTNDAGTGSATPAHDVGNQIAAAHEPASATEEASKVA